MLNSFGLAQRGDFTSAYGDFHYDQVPLMTVEELSGAFLPYMGDDARELLDDYGADSSFVEAQLLFYGVEYNKAELKGKGAKLLQKKLREGKLDKIPDSIQKLREELHMEWLDSKSPEDLVGWPDFAIRKYFVDDDGRPEPARTTSVIPFPFQSSVEAYHNFCQAAKAVPRLCHATRSDSRKLTVCMGWSKTDVQKTAGTTEVHVEKTLERPPMTTDQTDIGKKRGAGTNETSENAQPAKTTNAKRCPKHEKLLKKIRNYDEAHFHPEGRYIIDSAEIEKEQVDDLGTRKFTMTIRRGPAAGWYTATFDFGLIEGMVVMAPEKDELNRYCEILDREVDAIPHCGDSDCDHLANQEDEDDDIEEEIKPHVRTKRKAPTAKKMGSKSKKAKKSRKLEFLIRLKCRETEQGEICPHAEKGILNFDAGNYASFTAVAGLPYIGSKVKFKGRKVSDMARPTHLEWLNFSPNPHRRWT